VKSRKRKPLFISLLLTIITAFSQGQPSGSIANSVGTNICQGGSATFFALASGGVPPYTYSWNGVQGPSNILTVFAATLGSYNVTLQIIDSQNNTSPLYTDMYNVIAPSGGLPSVSLNSTTVCPYDTLRLTPALNTSIAGSSYCNALAPFGQCDIVPLPGTLPATYSVALMDVPTTCKTEFYFTINPPVVQSCSFLEPGLSTAPVVLSNQGQVPTSGNDFSINYDVTIPAGSNITFSNQQIYMAPGVRITVQAGGSLTITGCWLHACNCMWYGIEVQGNGSVASNGSTIIEDAIYAISTDKNPASTPFINVKKTLFNKNNIGILIQRKSNLSTNIDINDNIFTCRNFKQPNQFYLLNLKNSIPFFNNLLNFFNSQWFNLGQNNYPQYPKTITAYKHRSNAGVMIESYSGAQINIGQTAGVIGGLHPISNIFDYLNYGILARNADIYVHKNQFQNMPGNSVFNSLHANNTGPLKNLKAMGVGIYADNEALRNTINVGQNISKTITAANLFYNNLRAIDIYNYQNVDIGFNFINNTSTSPLTSFISPGTWNAQYGIQISNLNGGPTTLPDQVIHNNFIDRPAYGIHVIRTFYDAKKILILCNELGLPNNFNVSSIYMYQGIVLEDVAGNTNANIPTNGYAVSSNTIRHAMQNGIYASRIKKGLFIVFNGTKTFHWPGFCGGDVSVDPGTGPGKRETACIQTSFCENGSVFCNENLNGRHPGGHPKNRINLTHGILIDNSTRMTVTGNEVGRGSCAGLVALNWAVTFRGQCMPALFTNNKMMNSHIAYNLDGTIGIQGSSINPLNFDWQLGDGLNFQTNVTPAANANFSILNLRSNSIPTVNTGLGSLCGPGYPYDGTQCFTLINAAVSGSLFPGCGILFPGNGPGTTTAGGGTNPDGTPINIQVGCIGEVPNFNIIDTVRTLDSGRMQEVLEDSSAQAVLGPERVWKNRRFLWEHVHAKNLYNMATPDVQNFYNQNLNTGIGRLTQTEVALMQRDVTSASLLNSFAPANNLETKQQTVNSVKIKLEDSTLAQPAVNTADINTLYAIANGCPETDGAAFYEARALLNILHGQQLVYSSNCVSGNLYREYNEQEAAMLNGIYTNVYPNPNNGIFNIEVTGGENLELEIYNIFGQLILEKQYRIDNNTIKIEDLADGVYMVRLIIDGIHNKSQRIIVTK